VTYEPASDLAVVGSVRALTEVLALASPESYAQGVRLRRLAGEVLLAAGRERQWHIETAALICPIGGVAAPRALRAVDGTDHAAERMRELTARLPELADAILAPIPRADDLRAAILAQRARFDGTSAADPRSGTDIPLGGRVLRLVVDYDDLTNTGTEPLQAVALMEDRTGSYDPNLLEALGRVAAVTRQLRSVTGRNPLR
jgi:response regulator RpfG family c-di-GMP phosphodiesterase